MSVAFDSMFRYEVRSENGDFCTNSIDVAFDVYNKTEGEKALWDLKHMELLESSQDDNVDMSNTGEDDLPF